MKVPKPILLLLMLCLVIGCATVPNNKPDIFFPESFWEEGNSSISHQQQRFAENWQSALSYPEVRSSLKARLLLGPRNGYRMIDGNEILKLSAKGPVLIRHTRGGDQNPDGTWNPGCPGSFFQNRFGVYDRIQELRPDVAVVEIHVQENEGCSQAASRIEDWVLRKAQELNRQDPGLLRDFYRFWNIFTFNQKTKSWDLVANTADERRQAIHKAACDGWTWQLSPSTPFVFLYQDGKAVRRIGA